MPPLAGGYPFYAPSPQDPRDGEEGKKNDGF
nr:MAG TPA: hypothetical protein [Caudoviricetes sp.]